MNTKQLMKVILEKSQTYAAKTKSHVDLQDKINKLIDKLPNDMPVGLLDTTTDDFSSINYGLKPDQFWIDDYVKEEDGDIQGKMLFIHFENKLNENPI